MGGLSNTQVERLTGLIFALLLAAVFAQLWLSSAPIPWGGPNVMLAGAAVLLSLAYILLRLAALNPLTAGAALFRDLRPLLPTLAVSALLTLWAFLIHRFSNNLEGVRLAQMILGVGVLLAMYLAVERASRARLIVLALIAATFVSALFGLAVVWIGDPFLTLWLQFSSVRDIDLETILTYGRTAGLAAHTASFSYQLAAAVPMAFAALLYYTPFPPGRRATAYNLAMFLMLAVLTTALVVNGTRAAMLGALVAFAIIAAPALRLPSLKRRLAYTVPALAIWLLAFFNPTFTVGNLVGEVAAATGQDGSYGLVRSRSDFDGLVVGLDGLDGRNHRPVSGHRVEGVVAGAGICGPSARPQCPRGVLAGQSSNRCWRGRRHFSDYLVHPGSAEPRQLPAAGKAARRSPLAALAGFQPPQLRQCAAAHQTAGSRPGYPGGGPAGVAARGREPAARSGLCGAAASPEPQSV